MLPIWITLIAYILITEWRLWMIKGAIDDISYTFDLIIEALKNK